MGTCRGGKSPRGAIRKMPEGGIVKRLLMYVTPLSAMAVLVFAAIAAAQSVPQSQEATTPAESIASAPSRASHLALTEPHRICP